LILWAKTAYIGTLIACDIILAGNVAKNGILKASCNKYGVKRIEVMNWPIPIATISSHKLQFGRFVIFKTRGGITPVKAADKVNGGK